MRSWLVSAGCAGATAASVMLAPLGAWAQDDQAVQVEYTPPHLTVAASEVSLGEVLTEIAEKVGFAVALDRATSAPVTVTIERASVGDALRQLLRAENHTIVYRAGAQAAAIVERIVLLGAPSHDAAAAETDSPLAQDASAAPPDGAATVADPEENLATATGGGPPALSQWAEARGRATPSRPVPARLPDTER